MLYSLLEVELSLISRKNICKVESISYTSFAPGSNYRQLSDLYSLKTANCALVSFSSLEEPVFMCMKTFVCENLYCRYHVSAFRPRVPLMLCCKLLRRWLVPLTSPGAVTVPGCCEFLGD